MDNKGWIEYNEDLVTLFNDEYKVVTEGEVQSGDIAAYVIQLKPSEKIPHKGGGCYHPDDKTLVYAHTATVTHKSTLTGKIMTVSDFGEYYGDMPKSNDYWLKQYEDRNGRVIFYRKKTEEEFKNEEEKTK